jgi:hypothetical protein
MSVMEMEATRKDIFRMLLDINNEKVLTDIKYFLSGIELSYPEVPFHYTPEALRKMIDLSENAIYKGQVITSKQLKTVFDFSE